MYAPMKMGFPTGMAGGGITQFLQPLQEYLSQQVVQQQVQPFITEVSDEAQERFNLGGTGSNDILNNNIFDNDIFSGGIGTLPPPMSAGPDATLTNNNLLPAIKDAQALYGGMTDMEGNPSGIGTISGFPSVNELMQPAVPDIDKGFFDSQEYLDFMSKPQMGTQDVYMSRYFGQMGSGSLGRTQEGLYEDYLRRTGQTDLIQAKPPLADGFGNLFQLPSVGPMYGPEGTYSLTGRPQPVSGAVNQ